jgi:hypothetical protein
LFRKLHGIPRRNGRHCPVDQWKPHNRGHDTAVRGIYAAIETHAKAPVDNSLRQLYAEILEQLKVPEGADP